MTLAKRLTELICAGFSGIWVCTVEPEEAEREIEQLAATNNTHYRKWNIDHGLSTDHDCKDPISAIHSSTDLKDVITTYTNLHRLLDNVMVLQALFNSIIQGKQHTNIHIVLAPHTSIPVELQKHLVVVEHELPDEQTIAGIAANLIEGNNYKQLQPDVAQVAGAAKGLTRFEAEGAFALSLVRKQKLDPEAIWEIKSGTVKKSGLLQLHRNGVKLDTLGGMEGLKQFAIKSLSNPKAQPRGILLIGVPGTGKSAFAKCLGNTLGLPTLIADIGSWKGSLVGETEQKTRQALKIADAMEPCILFFDEIEKALAGANAAHSGDSGVSADQLGTLLTWLNDHKNKVYPIMTCNDIEAISNLSAGAFTRAERFDAVWFLDLPTKEQKTRIWNIHEHNTGIADRKPRELLPDDEQWTGAEIAACCRLATLLDVSLMEAASYIIPVAIAARERITKVRDWATTRALDAETGRAYEKPKSTATRRKVAHA
jgi:hypothetical protein